MLNAQTLATYSSVFALLECGRFVRQFRITANACYISTKIIPPPCTQGVLAPYLATLQKQASKARTTTYRRYLSAKLHFLFENAGFEREKMRKSLEGKGKTALLESWLPIAFHEVTLLCPRNVTSRAMKRNSLPDCFEIFKQITCFPPKTCFCCANVVSLQQLNINAKCYRE